MPNQPKPGTVRIEAWMSAALRDQIRAKAATENISQSEAVRRAIEEYVRGEG
jgi:hypothetical protein